MGDLAGAARHGVVLSDRATLRLEHGGALDAEIAPAEIYQAARSAGGRDLRDARRAQRVAALARRPEPPGVAALLRRSAELDAHRRSCSRAKSPTAVDDLGGGVSARPRHRAACAARRARRRRRRPACRRGSPRSRVLRGARRRCSRTRRAAPDEDRGDRDGARARDRRDAGRRGFRSAAALDRASRQRRWRGAARPTSRRPVLYALGIPDQPES